MVTGDGDLCASASIAVGGLVPAPVKATSVEQALIGQTLNVENIMAASIQVADDLGGDLIGYFYASAEYRKAMAAVEIRHAVFHITGEAHHGSKAEMPVSDPGSTAAPASATQPTESVVPQDQPRKWWWEFWRPRR